MQLTGMGAAALAATLTACGGQSGQEWCAAGTAAQVLQGTVTAVHDGDSFTLSHPGGQAAVRLQGIDAPELAQPWGQASLQALRQLTLHQPLRVAYDQQDRYGRLLGQVFSAQCEHLNLRMLREGQARFYRAYACDLPPSWRQSFRQAEQSAAQRGLGLWQQVQPQAPWVFRNGEDPPEPVCSP